MLVISGVVAQLILSTPESLQLIVGTVCSCEDTQSVVHEKASHRELLYPFPMLCLEEPLLVSFHVWFTIAFLFIVQTCI